MHGAFPMHALVGGGERLLTVCWGHANRCVSYTSGKATFCAQPWAGTHLPPSMPPAATGLWPLSWAGMLHATQPQSPPSRRLSSAGDQLYNDLVFKEEGSPALAAWGRQEG